jgi:Uma2 family endonuclease
MTAPKQHEYISEEEYLVFERRSVTKHEYYNGRVYAMTGAKEAHNLIAGNILASLHGQLRRKPCRVYPSDMRVKVIKTGLNTYPDIVVVCGQPEFTDEITDTITNPVVIIEILSPSTERYDRGLKFQNYRTIDTLRDYLLVAQDHSHIEHFSRQDNGLWVFQEAIEVTSSIQIQSIESSLHLQDVYEKMDFEQSTPDFTREIPSEE